MRDDYPVFHRGDKVRIADPAGFVPRAEARGGNIGYVDPRFFGQMGEVRGPSLGNVYVYDVYVEELGYTQAIHADYLTLVEPAEESTLSALDSDLGDIIPKAESDENAPNPDYSDIDDPNREPEDITVEQNDVERGVTSALRKAVLKSLKPGMQVRTVPGAVRVFRRDGKADVVYLRPWEIVTVIEVGKPGEWGEYLPERTVKVRRSDGVEQYVDVTSLSPANDEQRKAVTDAYIEEAGGEDGAKADLEDADKRRAQHYLDKIIAVAADFYGKARDMRSRVDDQDKHEMNTTDREEEDNVDTVDDFLKALGMQPEPEPKVESDGLDEDSLKSVRATLESLVKALPEHPVARRMALIAYAKEVAATIDKFPTSGLVMDIARFLAEAEEG